MRTLQHADTVKYNNLTAQERQQRKVLLRQAGLAQDSVSTVGSGGSNGASKPLPSTRRPVSPSKARGSPKRGKSPGPPLTRRQRAAAQQAAAKAAAAAERARQERRVLACRMTRVGYVPSSASIVAKEHAMAVRRHVLEQKAEIKAQKVGAK